MAVQAQHLSRAFAHDLHAFRALENATASGPLFFGEHGGGCAPALAAIGNAAVFSDVPRSELTCNDNNSCDYGFLPRKRARVAAYDAAGFVEGQQHLVLAAAAPQGIVPLGDVLRRTVGSGAASTSGRMVNTLGSTQGLLSQLYNQGVEIDALVRVETERMRAGLEEARQRHVRALVAVAERAAAGRLRAADTELERARCRNAELEEKLRQMSAEGQAWMGVAKSHETVAVGLRATLDQLLQNPCAGPAAVAAAGEGGDAEDAESFCFDAPAPAGADDAASKAAAWSCKACGEGEACMLLLPCRHLCLCRSCQAAVDTCPVCAAAKNASVHVLLS